MVRAVGIEPTLLTEPDFESGASTSSTTPAILRERITEAFVDVTCLPDASGLRPGRSFAIGHAR